MIIKRWNGTTYDELHPKTLAGMIYAPDTTTTIFDGNTKIKPAYLPDSVFDSLVFCGVANSSNLYDYAYAIVQELSARNRSFMGGYIVTATAATVTSNASAVNVNTGGVYYITSFMHGDGDGTTYPASVTLEVGDWVICTSISGAGTVGDPYIFVMSPVNNTYEVATSISPGIVKYGDSATQTTAANAVTTTASRSYAVQSNGSNQMLVNVPWVNTTYSPATATVAGLIELFNATVQSVAANAVTTTASRTYGLQVNSDGQGVINVPWTDTTYSPATATVAGLIELADVTVQGTAANAVTSTASRTYGLQVNAAGQGVINVPWVDTTYSAMSDTVLGLGKVFNNTTQSVAANTVTTTAARTYGVQKNGSDQLVVNVPWTDTTYAMMSSTVLGLGKLFDNTVQSVAAAAVTATASRTYGVQKNGSDQLVVNVPWTDNNTTYTAGTRKGLNLNGTAFEMVTPVFIQAADPGATGAGDTGLVWFNI
jgi:hypothetical protein